MVASAQTLSMANLAEGNEEESKDVPLPRLRQDLGLYPAPRDVRGEKGWMLHDPLRNRYFRIGEQDFLLLSSWDKAETLQTLLEIVKQQNSAVAETDILELADFLSKAELVSIEQGAVARLGASWKLRQQQWWKKLLHNYLFFKIPLIRPDAVLARLYPSLRFLLSRRFTQITLLTGMVGIFMVLRQWDIFIHTFMGFLNWQGAASFAVALAFVKILHEGGHAIACKHYGLRVPTIGVAFIVMWPVMYTDATEAWRLTSRKARITIAAAGMLTELTIACYATLLWVLLPDGVLRSAVFTLATTTWVMSVIVNLNPLMRFDGYYLFSDVVNIPNLQERGFELARNRLRHILFGLPLRHDSGLTQKHENIAIIWAYATWVYRFFLFLGIAFLVYKFFFKALGIFLFCVEIWWFLAAPIYRELKNWKTLWPAMAKQRQKGWLFAFFMGLLIVSLPWESSFQIPAVMRTADFQRFYPAEPARILSIAVKNGQLVKKGQVLFELDSPDLQADIAKAHAEVVSAQYERMRVMASQDTSSDRQIAEETLARADAALQGVMARQQRLSVVAPFDGIMSDIPVSLHSGLWRAENQSLGLLAGSKGGLVADAWVSEEYLRFVRVGEKVRFYPDELLVGAIDGVVAEVDALDSRTLPEPYIIGSKADGIPVRYDREGQAIPEYAVYRVRIILQAELKGVPFRVVRGHVRLSGDSRSLLGRSARYVMGVFRRESGF